jgi:hypothetical protein
MWEMGFVAIYLAICVLCAYALYRAAEREQRNPWVWGVAGLLANIFAVLAFRMTAGPLVKP